jgi:hypothetical protein
MSRIQLWKARGIPAYLICRVDPETGCYSGIEADSVLVQVDWDYPSLAQTFGWDLKESQWRYDAYPQCQHSGTDGTVKCPDCRQTPSAFISDAREYLDNHLGKTVEDPGYFS